ncbi:MAG: glycosyltransferase [Candidatus Micrarchaeia archaeon]
MITIIVPVHNEAGTLRGCVMRIRRHLDSMKVAYEIILAEDGSTDQSLSIARSLAAGPVRVLSSEKRLGRGLALSDAIRSSKGEIVIYMDADLSTDLQHIGAILEEVGSGSDIATGSRLLPGSTVRGRTFLRTVSSRGYNLLLRVLFGSRIHDHQCGFKAFRRSSVIPLLAKVGDRHWFWDSELLLRAQEEGLKVSEIPVRWTDRLDSRVSLGSDIISMGAAAIRLRLRL